MNAEKWRDLLRSYSGYVAVALVSLAYIATSFVVFEGNQKSLPRILADGVAAFLMGILINRIFDTQGILVGERDERVIAVSLQHGQIVDRICGVLDVLEDWCEWKNAEALRRARRKYLSMRGMRYEEYFDADGMALPFEEREVRGIFRKRREFCRRLRFERAIRLRLTRLSAGVLISEGGDANDPYYMGRSKHEYISSSARRDVIVKLLLALVFGYYSAELIRDFNPAYLIWTVFQVAVFLAMGVMKMQQSALYVTDEYRGRIVKKIDVLQQFETDLQKEETEDVNEEDEPSVGLLRDGE